MQFRITFRAIISKFTQNKDKIWNNQNENGAYLFTVLEDAGKNPAGSQKNPAGSRKESRKHRENPKMPFISPRRVIFPTFNTFNTFNTFTRFQKNPCTSQESPRVQESQRIPENPRERNVICGATTPAHGGRRNWQLKRPTLQFQLTST